MLKIQEDERQKFQIEFQLRQEQERIKAESFMSQLKEKEEQIENEKIEREKALKEREILMNEKLE